MLSLIFLCTLISGSAFADLSLSDETPHNYSDVLVHFDTSFRTHHVQKSIRERGETKLPQVQEASKALDGVLIAIRKLKQKISKHTEADNNSPAVVSAANKLLKRFEPVRTGFIDFNSYLHWLQRRGFLINATVVSKHAFSTADSVTKLNDIVADLTDNKENEYSELLRADPQIRETLTSMTSYLEILCDAIEHVYKDFHDIPGMDDMGAAGDKLSKTIVNSLLQVSRDASTEVKGVFGHFPKWVRNLFG